MRYRVPEGITADTLELDGLTRMGEPYTLWAVTETPEAGALEEKDAEQTFDVSVYSNIPDEARGEVKETIEYSDEDGFAGTLTLADLTVGADAQEDGTYIATTRYTGTVSRSLAGEVCYELYYAPVNAPGRAGAGAGDPQRCTAAHHACQPGAVHFHLYADDFAPPCAAPPARGKRQTQSRAACAAQKAEDLCARQRHRGWAEMGDDDETLT